MDPPSDDKPIEDHHLQPGLLVASPQLKDPFFAKAVVLLCRHEEDGAMGLVINRSTNMEMGAVLKDLSVDPEKYAAKSVLWGGPVEPGRGTLVFRQGVVKTADALDLSREISVSGSLEVLEQLIGERGESDDWFLSLGYAGWGPGQLDREIQEGSWIVLPLDHGTVFEHPLEERYDRCIATLGVDVAMIFMTPIDE